jgi:lipoprotein NlpD
VKHNADFLSAYAHCDRIYVKEGDVVKGGQKIADMGSSGTDRVKLHFEIRRRGTPVDPLDYLPRK